MKQTYRIGVGIYAVFFCVAAVLGALAMCHPRDLSVSERRPLAQLPHEITLQSIFAPESGQESFFAQWERFSADQFPFRESFRSLKARYTLQLLRLPHNNRLSLHDGYLIGLNDDFQAERVAASLEQLGALWERCAQGKGARGYLCLIPDKHYFLARETGVPAPDYAAVVTQARELLRELRYIDVFPQLRLEDYYRTDSHWQQQCLLDVAAHVGASMGARTAAGEYETQRLEGFHGVYSLQSGLSPAPDTLIYLTSPTLDACTVYDYETGETSGIYRPELFGGRDGYDVFLGGARALLRIDNPLAEEQRELIVLRDSFGSSLIPLLCEGYSRIYVADLRYITSALLGELVDFSEADVLFLYSVAVLDRRVFR